MAPWLVTISNQSNTSQWLLTADGKPPYYILRGTPTTINSYLSDKIDTKIEINQDDDLRYLLKYDNNYNIMINNTLGRNNDVADTYIRTYYDNEEINIDIFDKEIKIWCTAKDLRVYKPDGELSEYYKSVLVSQKEGGGIDVTGVDTVAGQHVEDGDEGGPISKD